LNAPSCLLLFYLSSAGLFLLPYGSYFVLMMSLYLTIFRNKTPLEQVCAVFNKFFCLLYIVYLLTIINFGSLLAYTWKTQKLYFIFQVIAAVAKVLCKHRLWLVARVKKEIEQCFSTSFYLSSYILDSNGHMPAYAMQLFSVVAFQVQIFDLLDEWVSWVSSCTLIVECLL